MDKQKKKALQELLKILSDSPEIADRITITIKPNRAVFKLISTIQDEVHRFSVGYHHKKHSKAMLSLQLMNIQGIGKTRAKELLKHFGEINKIAVANVEQLEQVKGMTKASAKSVYDFYHQN